MNITLLSPALATASQWDVINTTDTSFISDTATEAIETFADLLPMPVWRRSLWAIIFVLLVAVGTVGNLIVIWIVVAHDHMRTQTNILLVNLAVADFMMSTMNVTFSTVFSLTNHWPFGRHTCKLVQFVNVLSVSVSVLTMVMIALDRYIAIVYPLRPRISKKCTKLLVVVIWTAAVLLSSPTYIVSELHTFHDKSDRIICFYSWSEDDGEREAMDLRYTTGLFVFTYLVPLVGMAVCYCHVAIKLWGSRSIGEETPFQVESIKSKRRVVKMMITIVLIFAICWLPYHLYYVITNINPKLTFSVSTQDLFLGIYWLAMSNSMYNPIIYYWMNSKFRQGFHQSIRCSARSPNCDSTSAICHRSRGNQPTIHVNLNKMNEQSTISTCHDSRHQLSGKFNDSSQV